MRERIIERFLKYAKFDSQSSEKSNTRPSSIGQMELAKIIKKDLEEIGMEEVRLTDTCYLTAVLKSNCTKKTPTIGFLAHMDLALDVSAKNIKPQIVKNYTGEDIILNKEKNIILSPDNFESLKNYIGQTLITTDGNTLLGADDKAGIVEIIEMIEFFIANPNSKHGDIKIGFTPDEEIGEGAHDFDIKGFNADFAYTVDSEDLGIVEYETFNAAEIKITIKGKSIHPGSAKNKLINSILIAQEINSMLPAFERPEHTEKYEGYYYLYTLNGNIEKTDMTILIRDHSKKGFENRKQTIKNVVQFLNDKYAEELIKFNIKDQYYNMEEKIATNIGIVDLAIKATRKIGVEAKIEPVRGGTDGSILSYKGLLTPNLSAGYHNCHGRYEYVVVESMEKVIEILKNIVMMSAK